MIARDNRFHGHSAVARVRGSSVHSKNLSFRWAKNNRNDYRLAVVVSKKIDNRAVVRNRIRRRVFEEIRKQGSLNGKSVDLVVYIKTPEVQAMEVKKLHEEIAQLTQKILSPR